MESVSFILLAQFLETMGSVKDSFRALHTQHVNELKTQDLIPIQDLRSGSI